MTATAAMSTTTAVETTTAAVETASTAMEATYCSVKAPATAPVKATSTSAKDATPTVEGSNAAMVTTPTAMAIPSSTVMPAPSIAAAETPTAANPNPTVIPTPVTRCPIVIGARRNRNHFLGNRRRSLVRWCHVRDNRLRRLLGVGIRSWWALIPKQTVVGQHCHDNRGRDSGFLETQNRIG